MIYASSFFVIFLFACFELKVSFSLQSLYSEARQVRTLQGHDEALPLYREILRLNPGDVTAATRIAADERSAKRHDKFGKGGDRTERLRFGKYLESFDFRCNSIADLVFATDTSKADRAKRSSAPLFLQPLCAGTQSPPIPTCPLSACIQLLLLAVCLPTKTCVNLLGSEFLELLENLGLAYISQAGDDSNSLLVPYVHVFPVSVSDKTIYLATDLHPNVLSRTSIGGKNECASARSGISVAENGTVMYIGPDSLALLDHWASLQNLKIDDRIIDIGCGSGIQALSLAVRSSGNAKVKCVDINERALRVTRFNFELNNIAEPMLILGNISSPHGRIFETESAPKAWNELLRESATYVVSNPPFLPVPVNDQTISSRYGLFSSGGSTGEKFLQSVIQLASSLLDRNDTSATLAIVSEFMNPNVDFNLRLSSWWNDDKVPAQALLLTNEQALDATVYSHRRADSLEEAIKWEQHLQMEGIKSVSPGLMFLKRSPTTSGIKSQSDDKIRVCDSCIVNLTHCLVPKTQEGSIWTPTNFEARDFTRHHINKFLLL